jgi:membrane-associated phospholipid phosphatase
MYHRIVSLTCVLLIVVAGCQQAIPASALRQPSRRYEQANLRQVGVHRTIASGHAGGLSPAVLLLTDVEVAADSAALAQAGLQSAGPTTSQVPRGPAYPDDKWRSLGRDLKDLPTSLWEDTKHVYTDLGNLLILTAAGGAAVAVRAAGVDGDFGDHFRDSRGLNKAWDSTFDAVGNPGTHFALAAAGYALTLSIDDIKGYETSKTLFNALIINGVSTLLMQVATNAEAPNGDNLSFPSGHTSSSFTMAAVLDEAYGPLVGVPLYALAALVGYERVQARSHDFSDVAFGAVLGLVIGKSVAREHRPEIFGMEVVPYVDPESGTSGLALVKQW